VPKRTEIRPLTHRRPRFEPGFVVPFLNSFQSPLPEALSTAVATASTAYYKTGNPSVAKAHLLAKRFDVFLRQLLSVHQELDLLIERGISAGIHLRLSKTGPEYTDTGSLTADRLLYSPRS
jgi:hypothetical protein